MNILMVVSYFYDLVGGTQTLVREISRGLVGRGHNVDILTVNLDEKYNPLWEEEIVIENGSKIIRWPSKRPFSSKKYLNRVFHKFFNSVFILKPGLGKIAKKYDIIQFYDVNDLTFPLFFLLSNVRKTFLCATLSERFSLYKNNFLPRLILKKSANFFLSSNQNTTNLLKKLSIKEWKIIDIPYGVDIKKFSPSYEDKEDDLLLFTGAIEERKGLHVLLDACKKIKKKIKLIIAGPIRDREYFEKIKPYWDSINRNYQHRINYLNFVDEGQLVDLYKKATIFICPSINEEFGIVIIEAMACGTPVIASRVGGIPYVVRDSENGILVSPGDSVELSDKINTLLYDKEKRMKMGMNARNYVKEKYSLESVIEKLEETFYALISKDNQINSFFV